MLTVAQIAPVHVAFDQGLKAWVDETILFGMDPDKHNLRECKIIGLSSYPDEVLTAEILVKEEDRFATAWSHVPFHLLFGHSERPKKLLGMDDLYYHNCPDEHITFTFFPDMAQHKCWAYFKHQRKWIGGDYLGTVNWYRDNLNAHIIRLNRGQFALLPNHKLQFNSGDKATSPLPPYRKVRQGWSLKP